MLAYIIGVSKYIKFDLIRLRLKYANLNVGIYEVFLFFIKNCIFGVSIQNKAKKNDVIFLALPYQLAIKYIKALLGFIGLLAHYSLSFKIREKNCFLYINIYFRSIASYFGIILDAKSVTNGCNKNLDVKNNFISANAYSPIRHSFCNIFTRYILLLIHKVLFGVYIRLKICVKSLEILYKIYKNEKFICVKNKFTTIKNIVRIRFLDGYSCKIFMNSIINNLLYKGSFKMATNANLICSFNDSFRVSNFTFIL